MKEELYQWVRNMAVFYILFTAILNLVPDKKYEKYVRFFMGLLLIFMMSTPIFSLFGKGQELTGNFQYGLSVINAAYTSHTRRIRAPMGMSSPALLDGYPLPS